MKILAATSSELDIESMEFYDNFTWDDLRDWIEYWIAYYDKEYQEVDRTSYELALEAVNTIVSKYGLEDSPVPEHNDLLKLYRSAVGYDAKYSRFAWYGIAHGLAQLNAGRRFKPEGSN